jgi:hypothetical protein
VEHPLEEERNLREHEGVGKDHAEIDGQERRDEPDQASNAPLFRLLGEGPAIGFVVSRLCSYVCWQGFWHQENGQQMKNSDLPTWGYLKRPRVASPISF